MGGGVLYRALRGVEVSMGLRRDPLMAAGAASPTDEQKQAQAVAV